MAGKMHPAGEVYVAAVLRLYHLQGNSYERLIVTDVIVQGVCLISCMHNLFSIHCVGLVN